MRKCGAVILVGKTKSQISGKGSEKNLGPVNIVHFHCTAQSNDEHYYSHPKAAKEVSGFASYQASGSCQPVYFR